MSWNRHHGALEPLMAAVLKKKRKPMTLQEIVEAIQETSPERFVGKTPKNSLYSIIYRNEMKRVTARQPTRFLQSFRKAETLYALNPEFKEEK